MNIHGEDEEDSEYLRGEREFYQLLLSVEKPAVDIAQRLGLTRAELDKIYIRWRKTPNLVASGMSALVSTVIVHLSFTDEGFNGK